MKSFALLLPAALLGLALAGTTGCGGGQTRIGRVFDTEWQDDQGRSIAAVQAKLSSYAIPKGANVAVGVVATGLAGVDLDSGKTWQDSHPVDARPWIAGNVVVGTGKGEVFALEASSGRKLWSRPTTGRVRGAGDDGATTVVSLEPAAGRGAVLLAIDRDGKVARQLETEVPIGVPAAVANLAFIPWQNQYVTVYDLSGGDEIARVTLRQQTGYAQVIGGSLYFGELGLTRFDDKIGLASRNKASYVALPARELPGNPRWMRPSGFVLKPVADAVDQIALYARPEPADGRLTIDSQRYYATYYRIVVGLSSDSGELRWARNLGDDVLAGAAYEGGVALCRKSGTVSFFDAKAGADQGQVAFGQPLRSCVVQADTLQKQTKTPRTEPVSKQIADAIQVDDTEMVAMHRFLLKELVKDPSDAVTAKLIELAGHPRLSPALEQEVREGLASRRNGTDAMLQALRYHYDYLKPQATPPPVGPLADALAALNERRAAPLLAQHLNDPNTPPQDLKHVASALVTLATPEQLAELRTFFALYRCTAESDEVTDAVVSVAKALLKVGGEQGRALVTSAASDPMTLPALRASLSQLVPG